MQIKEVLTSQSCVRIDSTLFPNLLRESGTVLKDRYNYFLE